jgi:hypothetical protein
MRKLQSIDFKSVTRHFAGSASVLPAYIAFTNTVSQ